jgi:hypothetical protein
MPRKGKQKQGQVTLHSVGAYPLLKKPAEAIGMCCAVPGSYWEGRMTEEEKKTLYKCAVMEYTTGHGSRPCSCPCPGS